MISASESQLRKQQARLPFYVRCDRIGKLNTENGKVSEGIDPVRAPMKRETGASPVRTRHRKQGAKGDIPLGDREGA